MLYRSSHLRCSMKKDLRNCAKFTGKHCSEIFEHWNFLEHLFTEHLWTTASGFVKCSVIKLKRNKSAAKKIWIFFLSLKETCMQKLYSRKSAEGCFHIHKLLIKLLHILKFEHNLLTYYLLYLQLKSDALQGTLYFNNF